MSIRVLLVDDHPGFRKLIAGLLSRYPEIDLIGEAGDGEAALALACQLAPDVMVADLELPGVRGEEIAFQLQVHASPLKILFMSAHMDRIYIQTLLECTAASYLVKDDAPAYLVETIGRMAQGEVGWFGGDWGRAGERSGRE